MSYIVVPSRWHQLLSTYDTILTSLPRRLEPPPSRELNDSHDGRAGRRLINESHLGSCDHNSSHEREGRHQ